MIIAETDDVGTQTKNSLFTWHRAALKFQSAWRGFLGRRKYLKKKKAYEEWQKEQERKRHEAATKIQSRYRGHMGRRNARRKKAKLKPPEKPGVDVGRENVLETIANIYNNKLQMIFFQPKSNSKENDDNMITVMCLTDYLNIFFRKRHKVKDTKVSVSYNDLQVSVKSFSKEHDNGIDHGRITWFGTLLGWVPMEIHEDVITAYHPDASKVYLYLLYEMLGDKNMKKEICKFEAYISNEQAENAIRAVFKKLYNSKKSHMKNCEKIIAKLEGKTVKTNKKKNTKRLKKKKQEKKEEEKDDGQQQQQHVGEIEIDYILGQVMRYWYRHSADFDDNGKPVASKDLPTLLFKDLIGKNAIEETDEVKKSAQKIQAVARGRKARKEKKEQVEAVNKIAAVQRGRKARKEKKEQEKAASKIAAVQRGRKARKEKKEQVEAVNKIAAVQRGRKARKEKKEKDQAAAKLQAVARGRKVRKDSVKEKAKKKGKNPKPPKGKKPKPPKGKKGKRKPPPKKPKRKTKVPK